MKEEGEACFGNNITFLMIKNTKLRAQWLFPELVRLCDTIREVLDLYVSLILKQINSVYLRSKHVFKRMFSPRPDN